MTAEDRIVIEFDAHDLKQLEEIFHAARAEIGQELQQGFDQRFRRTDAC